jgi:Protein of unknown function (DUF3006)
MNHLRPIEDRQVTFQKRFARVSSRSQRNQKKPRDQTVHRVEAELDGRLETSALLPIHTPEGFVSRCDPLNSGMKVLIVESIEPDLANCSMPDGRSLDVPRAWLPEDLREGDHLDVASDGLGLVQFSINREATQAALETNTTSLEQLNANDSGGNVNL